MNKILNIGKDFHPDPGGRFYADGKGNGEEFREEYLVPQLKSLDKGEKLTIILDDSVESYGSSFLSSGFAKVVVYGYYTKQELLDKLDITYQNSEFEFYKNKIEEYIAESDYKSEIYEPRNAKP